MAEFSDKSTLNKFDVISFAKNILVEVDEIRAFDNLTDLDTLDNFKVPNESRINAFFRLVGLPMFISVTQKKDAQGSGATGLRSLTPGFSANMHRMRLFKDYVIENADNVDGNPVSKLLVNRETNLQRIENSIGNEDVNRNMALSLSIPAPLAPNIPDPDNQIGAEIGSGDNKREIFKKLFPLITYYREIFPKRNEIAVPFASKEDRVIDSTMELPRPFIETVARIRLVNAANAGSVEDKDRESSQLLSLSGRLAEDDYEKLLQQFNILKAADILEAFILNKLFISVEQLANKWVEIKKKQQLIAKQDVFDISIKTTSAKRNPLGKRVSISSDLSLRKESSEGGQRLAWLRKKEAEEEAFLSLLPSDDVVNNGDISPKTAITSNTSLGALINEFTDLLNNNLTQIKKEIQREEARIKKNIQTVEQLRLEIDMMTGEFSGLSIPDVVAVITGLFLIEKRDLVSLLDKGVLDSMKEDKVLKKAIEQLGAPTSVNDVYQAVQNLEIAVSAVFYVLQLYIKAIGDKEKRSARGVRKEKKQQSTESSLSNRTAKSQS